MMVVGHSLASSSLAPPGIARTCAPLGTSAVSQRLLFPLTGSGAAASSSVRPGHRGPSAPAPRTCTPAAHPTSAHINCSQRPGLFLATQFRGVYFPRFKWFAPYRRMYRQRKNQARNARNVQPRYRLADRQKESAHQAIGGSAEASYVYRFRQRQVRVSLKKLIDYGRLLQNRNLQDAIDFLESLARSAAAPITECLRNARENLVVHHGKDPARLVLATFQSLRGRYVKSLMYKSYGKVGIARSPRNHILIGVREMSLEEFFQKCYVIGKVPTTLTMDMRTALFEGRCGPEMHRQWSPYLSSTSRWLHRRRLKYLDATRQLDYYKLREQWIRRYQGNFQRKAREARASRGLSEVKIGA